MHHRQRYRTGEIYETQKGRVVDHIRANLNHIDRVCTPTRATIYLAGVIGVGFGGNNYRDLGLVEARRLIHIDVAG